MGNSKKQSELEIEIVKTTLDEDAGSDRDVEGSLNKKSEKKSGAQARFSLPKPTVFDLYNEFMMCISCANIGGMLHIYNPERKFFSPTTQRELEEIILDRFYNTVVASGSTNIVKRCAELIMRRKPKEVLSPDKKEILCLEKGYLPLDNMENTYLHSYVQGSGICPTYLINAAGYSNMHNWGLMKNLSTETMDAFLDAIACKNPVIVERIWQMLGYLLTPDIKGKCFFLLQGVPNSGKSVLGNLIKTLISSHRIASLDIDQLGKKNATSVLLDKSINISMDLPNKALLPLAIRNIKLITGNDDVTVEFANGTYATYHGGCKFLFATNHALTLRGCDLGFEERIVCIPFTNSIPAAHRNRNLLADLLNEKDMIVAKALAYYRDLRNNNYVFAGSNLDVCKTKIRYLPIEAEDMDATLCQFVDDRCKFVSDKYGTYTEDLHDAYLTYCREHGYTPIDNKVVFSRRFYKCYSDKVKKDKWRSESIYGGEERNQNGFLGVVLEAMSPQKINGVWNV